MNKIKKIVIMAIVCVSQISCTGQKKENKQPLNINKSKMKKFDIKQLGGKTIDSELEYTKADTVFKIIDNGVQYVEQRRKIDENLKTNFVYDKQTLQLVKESSRFSDAPVGIYREYDKIGKVIKEIDRDKNFLFSITDVIQLSKNKLKIDLNNTAESITVHRGLDDKIGKYVYDIKQPIDEFSFRFVKIDAETGEIITDVTGHYTE